MELCAGRDHIMKEKDMATCIDMLRKKDFIPVMAHVERYHLSIDSVQKLKDMGACVQINLYSITDGLYSKDGEYTRDGKYAAELLENQLADFIGTDAHRVNERWIGIKHKKARPVTVNQELLEALYKKYPEDYLNDIFYNNAKKYIIDGKVQ